MGAKRSSHNKVATPGAGLEDFSDRELAHLACQGTQEAWQVLYLRYFEFLLSFARKQLKLSQELRGGRQQELSGRAITAEQFVNEVYIVMWDKKKLCSYKGTARFRWWYETVAQTIYSDLLRQKRREIPPGIPVALDGEDDE
jgi:DNA-directed RNA polymerase specialized sigma24 family protein